MEEVHLCDTHLYSEDSEKQVTGMSGQEGVGGYVAVENSFNCRFTTELIRE